MKAFLGLFLTVPFLVWSPPAQAEDILILASKVYTMTGPPLTPGAVLVSKGKIRQIGVKIEAPAGAKVIDLGAGVLMPGLVDAYSQAGIAGGVTETTREITPAIRVVDSVDWRARAFREALEEGTTCMGIAPGTDNVFSGLSCAVKTAGDHRVIEPQLGVVIAMASDPASGNGARGRPDSIYNRQPTNRMGVVWMLRATFDKAARQENPELASVREGLQGTRKIFAVSRTDYDLLSLLRLAKEFKFTPTVIGGHEAYKVRTELAAAKVPVILGSLTTSSSLEGPENSDVIWNQPSLLQKAGVPFALSGGHLLEQARFATRFGLSADDALRAITSTPAQLLGIDKRVGTLSVGSDADLVALSGDPLELTTSIQWLLVDGKIYDKGE
ncbi:MAG TPA: amidohydrolase family protein [Gemmataceae bacterium]|nr:amidohydrolase family protein [Gemmataceae bacterium]